MRSNKKEYTAPLVALFLMAEADVIRTSGEGDRVIELDEISLL